MLMALKLKLHTKCIIITRKKLNQAIKHGIIKTVDGMSVLLTEQYYQLQSLAGDCRHNTCREAFQLKEAYMNFSYFAQEIKERLSTKEVISFYGVHIDSRGFARCPFHREKTASFKVYDGDKGYHCFGCGKTGDTIAFVQEYFGMSFVEAVKKLNEDFALGLPIDKKISRSRRLEAAKKAFNRRQSIKKWEKEQQRLEDEYWKCFDECFRLSCQIETYKPKTMDEEWHPLYVDGVQNITYSQYLLECAESARYEHERTNRCG